MKILVIGGGMSGLTYGIVACKVGHDVTLAERNARVGKKISVTGNGRCNLANENFPAGCYNNSQLARSVVTDVSVAEYKRFLNSCGIFTYTDSDGRVYPLSDSAAGVVDCLRLQFAKHGGKLLAETTVTKVLPTQKGYNVTLDGAVHVFDKVVLCCGSGSQAPKPDLTGIVQPEWLTPLAPSLVPVKVRGADKTLNGLRAKATVTLKRNGVTAATETGEVLFREYGLSGICVLNLSAVIARDIAANKGCDYLFVLDVVPQMDESRLAEILDERLAQNQPPFLGIVHSKLGEHIVKRADTDSSGKALAHLAKNLCYPFEKLLDWSMSQVTAGGLSCRFVNAQTLALPNGVVALGEALDVDGICGGYNLYFAAASALHTFAPDDRQKAYLLH